MLKTKYKKGMFHDGYDTDSIKNIGIIMFIIVVKVTNATGSSGKTNKLKNI